MDSFPVGIIVCSDLCFQEGCASCFPFLDRALVFENARVVLQEIFTSFEKVLPDIWRQIFVYEGNETEAKTESLYITCKS